MKNATKKGLFVYQPILPFKTFLIKEWILNINSQIQWAPLFGKQTTIQILDCNLIKTKLHSIKNLYKWQINFSSINNTNNYWKW